MARRRRKTTRRRRRAVAPVAANPRRRRRVRRRRHNPIVARRTRRSVTSNPRRRRHHRRRRSNPSFSGVGSIVRSAIYGAGGAILTRVVAGIGEGFVPAGFAGSKLTRPILQAAAAATVVPWGVGKLMGKPAADLARVGGFISAGLEFFEAYLPGAQSGLSSILRAPIQIAQTIPQQLASQGATPDQIAQAGAQLAGLRGPFGDVEDVDMRAAFGDVEDIAPGLFA